MPEEGHARGRYPLGPTGKMVRVCVSPSLTTDLLTVQRLLQGAQTTLVAGERMRVRALRQLAEREHTLNSNWRSGCCRGLPGPGAAPGVTDIHLEQDR